MRLTLISLFLCISATFAENVNSQMARVNVHVNNASAKAVVDQIEEQTDYLFVYNYENVDLSRNVSVNASNAPVAEVLAKTFENSDVIYAMEGNNILLMKRNENMEPSQNQKKITGTIVDTEGEAIIGANIAIKGTKEGTASDVNGSFSLNVQQGAVLIVSYIGYVTQEISVGNQTDLKITLVANENLLSAVVVVGYGTQKKLTLTGAVSAINSEELMTTKTGNLQNALSGKIAGVKMMQRGSEPGSFDQIEFSIRGMGAPLVIIDGVPRDNIQRLDPNEVESVSVLKDASAAIYGVRAANGVILITTKRGHKGEKFKFEYSGYYGLQHDAYRPETRNAVQYMEMINELNFNDGAKTPTYAKPDIDAYRNGSKQSTDWISPFINDYPSQQQHNLSASGGSEKVDYFVNFGYYTQQYPYNGKDWKYDRYNVRSNVTARLAKGLKLEMLVSGLYDDQVHQPWLSFRSWYRTLWPLAPTDPLYVNGDPEKPIGEMWTTMSSNGVSSYSYKKRQFQSNAALEWEVQGVKGLKLRGMYSYDYTQNTSLEWRYRHSYYDKTGAIQWDTYNAYTKRWFEWINTMYQVSASYDNTIADVHNVSALLLYEGGNRSADNFWGSREPMLGIGQLFTGNAATQQANADTNAANLFQYVSQSVVGRFKYDYASKYLAEFSFRRDGSSKFPPKRRWGFFPSGFIGWRINEESFIKDNPSLAFIDNLKIRASVGVMGDDSALAYQFIPGYNYPGGSPSQFVFDGKVVNAITPKALPNQLITWSTSTSKNVGIDADFWKGLLGVTFEIFQRDRDGLLGTSAAAILPTEVGMSGLPQQNLNSDQTKGFELTLTHRRRVGNDFNYNIGATLGVDRSKNKYIERTGSVNAYRNWRSNNNERYGDILWGYDYLGQFKSFEEIHGPNTPILDARGNSVLLPGDLNYGDWNGDGVIDDYDVHPISSTNGRRPFVMTGLTFGADWKGIDLNLVLQGVTGHQYIYERGTGSEWFCVPVPNDYNGDLNGFSEFYDRWRRADVMNPDNGQAWVSGKYPSTFKRGTTRGNILLYTSDYWLNNASFLRVKSLEIGYTIPKRITQVAGIEKARFFVNGYNLFTFSKMKLSDPETGGSVADYPVLMQTFMFGANIVF